VVGAAVRLPCQEMNESIGVLIVGGGPAGAALGALLARAGRTVAIIEQSDAAHDKVCGDFLSYEAIHYLRALGIEPEGMGAVAVRNLRLASRELIGECALPFMGMGLSRRVLDESLLANARNCGADVLRGRRVEHLRPSGNGWIALLGTGEEIRGASAFVATGKHDLRGWPRPEGRQNDLIAFKMYFRLKPEMAHAIAGQVELVLFPGGYAGMLGLGGGVMNLCLLVQRAVLRKLEGNWRKLLKHIQSSSQYLARYLEGAEELLEKPLAISAIPYGYMRANAAGGVWRLGDQAAVIPSFSGDGISIALHSALIAAQAFLDGRTAQGFQEELARQLKKPVLAALAVSRIMVRAPAAAYAVRVWPEALRAITRCTRVPRGALISAAICNATMRE
jgi:menaquinone-9 beta-reductase